MSILRRIELTLADMSRRSIFFLVAAVVMLYFSIILFVLSPRAMHGSRVLYYAGMNNIDRRLNWCRGLRWRLPPAPHVVALVSHPGSGNTWLRYLLQQVTGIATGSKYMDYSLRSHGFPAENVTDGSVLVVKTHEFPKEFQSAILLIRDPRNAILADFHRLHRGHIGTAPKSAFKTKSDEFYKSESNKNFPVHQWTHHVSKHLEGWESLHSSCLTLFPGRLHIVFYEVLVRDTRQVLQGILDFLKYNVTEADMNCAIANQEGIFRRKKKHQNFDPYTADMYKKLDQVMNRVLSMAMYYNKKHREPRSVG